MNYSPIKKAVFPVAGLGTRFLPATKASPKEMLPIVDKPLIQYAVEEAVEAGITELVFVTNGSKRSIEDHFDTNYELEAKLMKHGKLDLVKIVRDILPKGVSCAYVRQHQALGLGHAVLCARPLIGNEPFAVLLADDLIDGYAGSCLKQMVAVYQDCPGSYIAVQSVAIEDVARYGIVELTQPQQQVTQIRGIVEKPQPEQAPSTLAAVGRYLLSPSIFTWLQSIQPGVGGEIQLTDAIHQLAYQEPVYAFTFKGKRYDCGNKLGYLEATLVYARKHPEIGKQFEQLLAKEIQNN